MDVSLETIIPPAPSPFTSDPPLIPSSIYVHVPSTASYSTSSTITTISSTSSPSSVASFPVSYSDFVSVSPSFAAIPSAKVIISSEAFAPSNSTMDPFTPSTTSASTKITISTSPPPAQDESTSIVSLSSSTPMSLSTVTPPSSVSTPHSSSSQTIHSYQDSMEPQQIMEEPGNHSANEDEFDYQITRLNESSYQKARQSESVSQKTRQSESGSQKTRQSDKQTSDSKTRENSNSGDARNPPSDCESDVVDLMKVMKKDRMEDDDNDSALQDNPSTTDEDDDDDDDFLVHFAHTGRKKTGDMASPPELLSQIAELQDAVVGMKSTLREAVSRLSSVVDEPGGGGGGGGLATEVTEARQRCQDNTAEVLKLLLSLRTDISSLQKEVSTISERQDGFQSTLTQVLEDRRLMLADLSQAGVISIHTRSRLEGGSVCVVEGGGGGGVGRSCSGSHSNDSGVALLLERAHQAFTNNNTNHTPSPTPTNHRASDQDSLPEQPSLLVPASVYDYVAGLRSHHHHHHHHTPPPAPPPPHSHASLARQGGGSRVVSSVGGEGRDGVPSEGDDLGLIYDSDSSLTIAANKTLSLSTSLSQQCGMELRSAHNITTPHHSTPHHSHAPTPHLSHSHTSPTPHLSHSRQSRALDRTHMHSDSDGSDRSRNPNLRHRHCSHEHGRESGDSSSDPYAIVITRDSRGDLRDPREAQRYRVARELLDTEKKYCKTLWTIQDTFAEPLKKAGILSHKDINTLFPEEVYQLYDKHCLLQHQLRERLASWKWQPLVGDVLARFTDPRHTDVLRLYTAYVNEFPEVLKTFHKLCRASQPFTKFIKGCLEQPSCAGLDLGAFLLTPVQRVPRYILLLKQLIKATPPPHPDHHHLHTTLERLRDFLARLNDSMEHSFQLVHAHLAPLHHTHHHSASPSNTTADMHHRPSRLPRRSLSSPASASPPLSPPISPTYSPTRSSGGGGGEGSGGNSPQRSHSCAAPPLRHPRSVPHDSRSSSLPRGSPSSSGSGSREAPSPPRELPRVRSRSESVASRRPRPALPRHAQDGGRNLSSALSVHDVSSPVDEAGHWVELAASEPSLLDPRPTPATSALSPGHSIDGGSNSGAPQPWPRTVPMNADRGKKKSSIRTSIKNMFTFKKSRAANRGVGSGDEGDYWEGPDVSEPAASPAHQQQQQTNGLSVVGDFVDEEGNPCSNV